MTVEKDGRIGLQRDMSSDSISTLARTISAGTDVESALASSISQIGTVDRKETSEDTTPKPVALAQTPKRIAAPAVDEAVPATPTEASTRLASSKPASSNTPKTPTAQTPAQASTPLRGVKEQNGAAGGSIFHAKRIPNDISPALPAEKPVVNTLSIASSRPVPDNPKKSTNPPTNGNASHAPPASSKGIPTSKAKDVPPVAEHTRTAAAATTSLPLRPKVAAASTASKDVHKTTATTGQKSAPKTISTAKASTKPPIKSPAITVKTPTSPAKPATPQATPGRTRAQSSTKKPAPIPSFPSNGIGFVKPKPKSPTRPVQLPSGLTTHTASSATKINVPRPSLSRQSGNFHLTHQPVVRSPSRASVSTVHTVATTTGTKSLRRQSSTVNRPRPSIGPPPKQPARDHPVTKREKELDDGFLARMMRPTQASASKTADKAHQSPPRKHVVVASRKGAVQNHTDTRPPRQSDAAVVKKTGSMAPPPPRVPKAAAAAPAAPVVQKAALVAAPEIVEEPVQVAASEQKHYAELPQAEAHEVLAPVDTPAQNEVVQTETPIHVAVERVSIAAFDPEHGLYGVLEEKENAVSVEELNGEAPEVAADDVPAEAHGEVGVDIIPEVQVEN